MWVALLVCFASIVSVEAALSAAIIEIVAGVVAGNFFGLHPAPWMDFLAAFGGILLTFLAGAEVDPAILRSKLRESLLIGGCSFLPHISPPSPTATGSALDLGGIADRGLRALDDVAGGRLRRPGRGRPNGF